MPYGIRMSELNREIDKTKEEIAKLERSLLETKSYLAGLEKALKLQSKQTPTVGSLRAGSDAHKAMEVLKAYGKAMHVDAILGAMGEETSTDRKTSLTGSLAAYVRKGAVFTRPAPNTFGLIETTSGGSIEELLS